MSVQIYIYTGQGHCINMYSYCIAIIWVYVGQEDDWKKALSQLNDDIDGKLDRLEFGKEQLEKQMKALSRKIAQLNAYNIAAGEDDAAGLKKYVCFMSIQMCHLF